MGAKECFLRRHLIGRGVAIILVALLWLVFVCKDNSIFTASFFQVFELPFIIQSFSVMFLLLIQVHGPESDIDALCVGPYFASLEVSFFFLPPASVILVTLKGSYPMYLFTLQDDFFIVLRGMLQSRPEVSELLCVKTAKVPLMRFKFKGVSIDFPYAQLRVVSVPAVSMFGKTVSIAKSSFLYHLIIVI